jgi:hypothetical protein
MTASKRRGEVEVLLSRDEMFALPGDVRAVLAQTLDTLEEYNEVLAKGAIEQAPTVTRAEDADEERVAEVDALMREGEDELDEYEILQGLADDGVIARGTTGSVDARILSDLAQQENEGERGRNLFAQRARLKLEQHGTLYTYVHGKCRCCACRAAMAAWKRERRRQKRQGEGV